MKLKIELFEEKDAEELGKMIICVVNQLECVHSADVLTKGFAHQFHYSDRA